MIKVSDLIAQILERNGVKHIFMLAGGMAMHMNDSIGKQINLESICMLHEQAAAFAAEGYARATKLPGVVCVTCGPAATNTLTAVAAAWIESTPLVVLSGQVKRDDMNQDPLLRQMGVQEINIVDMAKPITKYAKCVIDPSMIRYELEKALYISQHGRPGPVLLDLPVDVQACFVDENIEGFVPSSEEKSIETDVAAAEVAELLASAKRPVIYAGYGISVAKAETWFRQLVDKLQIPVLINWNAIDLLEEDHPFYAGRPGAVGQRAANFILQTADLVITIGTRLSLLQTGYNFAAYAKNAKLVMVDIDRAELEKKNLHPHMKICCDAGIFIKKLIKSTANLGGSRWNDWLSQAKHWIDKYPNVPIDAGSSTEWVNSYYLLDKLSRRMEVSDVYCSGRAGTCVDATIQAFKVKKYQQVYVTKGLSSMGHGLPAAIGCAFATGRRVVSVIGDGGFVMNIQELEVIRRHNLPIKIFVLDNNGYSAIRNTQNNVFNGHLVGCSPSSGLTLGNLPEICNAYGIKTLQLVENSEVNSVIAETLKDEVPVIVIVKVDPDQSIEPRQASYKDTDGQMKSRPLEDMRPLLPREELAAIMSIAEH